MRRIGVIMLFAALALVPDRGQAQEQFPGDPLPYTVGPFIYNQFMQLDNKSPQRIHTGIDIQTTYPGSDQSVGAPIRYGSDCQVYQMGPGLVRLLARDMRISAIVNSCFGIVNTHFGHRERSEATPGVQASS